MRKGQAKVRDRVVGPAEKRQESILAKCHPALFELAPLWKEAMQEIKRLGASPAVERVAELKGRIERKLEDIKRRHSGPVPPPPNTFTAQIIHSEAIESEAEGVAEWLHFERHRVPLKADVAKHRARDRSATHRILRTASDLARLYCGQRIQPFKSDLEHSGMFENFWGFGLERLTSEELADFFDWYCPCGSEGHDPEALKRQRDRFKRTLSRAIG